MSDRQQAQGQREVFATDSHGATWIRTVDGWEPSHVLEPPTDPATPPALHPLIVAGFQLSASLLALLAFPESCGTLAGRVVRDRGATN
jgi:hypothetical protein